MRFLPRVRDPRVGRRDILRLSLRFAPLSADFLLFLVCDDLRLLDLCRLPRVNGEIHGFPLSRAIGLAREANAAGIIIVQERASEDEVLRPLAMELTTSVRQMLEETGIELLDHFLLIRDRIVSVGGLSLDRGRESVPSEHPLDTDGLRRLERKPKPDYGNPAYWQSVIEKYEFMTVELGGRERERRKARLLSIAVVAGALAAIGCVFTLM